MAIRSIYARSRRVSVVSTGQVIRDYEIPPGFYWFDSVDSEDVEVLASREAYINVFSPEYFRILRMERVEPAGGNPGYEWILIQVFKNLPRWPATTKWGLPTVALHGSQTTRQDTVQRPEPEPDITESIRVPSTSNIKLIAYIGAGLLGGILIAKVLS